jgi:hypothetical protein
MMTSRACLIGSTIHFLFQKRVSFFHLNPVEEVDDVDGQPVFEALVLRLFHHLQAMFTLVKC